MDQQKPTDSLEQSLRRVRLERLAKQLGVSSVHKSTSETLTTKMPSSEGLFPKNIANTAPPVQKVSPPDLCKEQSTSPQVIREGASKAKSRSAAELGTKKSKMVSGRVMTSQDVEAEIILRRLIAMESSWQDMKPYAWEIFDKWPSAEIAGKMIELAYLHGTTTEVFQLLNQLKTKNRAGYFTVGADLRPYIVLKMWRSGKEGVLNHYLHQKTYLGQLLRVEKLFVFWSLYGCADQIKAWDFFRKFQDDIFSAVKEYGSQLKLRPSLFFLEVGKLAKRLGKDQDAIYYLEKIKKPDQEFSEALNILLTFKVQLDGQGYCLFGRQLVKESNWRTRLKLMSAFLEKVAMQQGMRHRERTALNNLLLKPLKWFPESAESWNQLSRLLAQYADLDHLLPNLFKVFSARQLEFRAPVFERALWEPLLSLETGDPYKKRYWCGVALVHRFVGQGCSDEGLLWEAKEQVEQSYGSSSVPDAVAWEKIHGELVLWISRTSKFNEEQRQEVLRRIKVVGHHLDISSQDIEAYISHAINPRLQTIDRLQSIAQKRVDPLTEMHLVLKKSHMSHFTNMDLERLWTLSRDLKIYDLSWRVASILFHRQVLSREIQQVWLLSGERRQDRLLRALPAKLIPLLYRDMSQDDKNLAQAILMIGERIPELLSMINSKVKLVKPGKESQFAHRVIETLQRHEWLGGTRKLYSSHPEFLTFASPPFAEFLPETPWTNVFMKLAEKLGIISWRWQLAWLHDELEGLIPKIHKNNDQKLKGRVGKWMRSLSPLQRKAWFSLVSLSGKYGHEDGFTLIGKILARFATCIYQDNTGALASLASMNVPLPILWDLEHWVVSPQYTEIRKFMQTYSSFDVPVGTPQIAIQKKYSKCQK